jgi:hypothetical protein
MLPSNDCAPAGDLCCTDWYDEALAITNAVVEALGDCIQTDCSEPFTGYVQAHDSFAAFDAVTFIVDGVTVRNPSKVGALAIASSTVLNGRMRLLETGWPTVTTAGDQVQVPSIEDLSLASMHFIAHGQKFHRTLMGMRASGVIQSCRFSAVGDMKRVGPQSNVIGWDIAVSTTVA